MAYTNSVGIMPGAATEKLPFVHSDFKPRSKFAKCFGGFKKYTRHGGNNATAREFEGQKLPLIHYSVGDQRNLVTLGSNNRSDRPEYQGFSGKKKLLKKKDNSSTTPGVHPAISGSFTRSQANAMKHYLSLPNLNVIHQHSDAGSFHNSNNSNNNNYNSVRSNTHYHHNDRKQRHHKNKEPEEMEFMNYLQQLQQQQLQYQQQQQQNRTNNNNNNNNNYNMDSLFIVDDEDDDESSPSQNNNNNNNTMVVGNGVKFRDPLTTTNSNSNSFPADSYERIINPFAKEVDKKLREARGKSGMKRGGRRDPDHMRILGDVVTAERMHELLLPRKSDAPLNFEENV